jgi:hypothetical protein
VFKSKGPVPPCPKGVNFHLRQKKIIAFSRNSLNLIEKISGKNSLKVGAAKKNPVGSKAEEK